MSARTLLWLLVGGGVVLLLAAAGKGVVAVWKQHVNASKWLPVIAAAEARHGIPRDLLARMAYQESHWRDDVIDGTVSSSAGALGLMQMLPQYFSSVRAPRPFSDAATAAQIEQAASELARLYGVFGGDWQLAVAAYNAGQGTVRSYLAGTRAALPAETQAYVADVFADVPV